MLRRLAVHAGIPLPNTVTPHALRASAITDQINRGRTAEQVRETFGNLDLRTVMIYVEQADQTELLTEMTQDLSRVVASIPTKVRSNADTPPA